WKERACHATGRKQPPAGSIRKAVQLLFFRLTKRREKRTWHVASRPAIRGWQLGFITHTLLRRVCHMPRKSVASSRSRVYRYQVKRQLEEAITLPRIQHQGFTHPQNGFWLMLPKE